MRPLNTIREVSERLEHEKLAKLRWCEIDPFAKGIPFDPKITIFDPQNNDVPGTLKISGCRIWTNRPRFDQFVYFQISLKTGSAIY